MMKYIVVFLIFLLCAVLIGEAMALNGYHNIILSGKSHGRNKMSVSNWVKVANSVGNDESIYALAVFNGALYGSTAQSGFLLRWDGNNAWIPVTASVGHQISSLCVFNNNLYGGSGAGRLYRWDTNVWTQVAPALAPQKVSSLIVYNGKLYGGTAFDGVFSGGRLWEWNGVNAWVQVAPKLGGGTIDRSINDLVIYNGRLYGCTSVGARLLRWNDVNAWELVADTPAGYSTVIGGCVGIAVFNERLYGISDDALATDMLEWDGVSAWKKINVGMNFDQSLTVFESKLFMVNEGSLYQWDGITLTKVADSLYQYMSILCLIVFNNKLYGGTTSSISTDWDGLLLEWYHAVTKVTVQETSEPIAVTDGTRVRTVRHITTLVPWVI